MYRSIVCVGCPPSNVTSSGGKIALTNVYLQTTNWGHDPSWGGGMAFCKGAPRYTPVLLGVHQYAHGSCVDNHDHVTLKPCTVSASGDRGGVGVGWEGLIETVTHFGIVQTTNCSIHLTCCQTTVPTIFIFPSTYNHTFRPWIKKQTHYMYH